VGEHVVHLPGDPLALQPPRLLDAELLSPLGLAGPLLERAHQQPPRADQHAGGDRWVDDLPDLPASANALLRVRARALAKGDGDEAARLRADLARLGVVVRDDGRRQYWRRSGRPTGDADPEDTMGRP
jgi:hypothetical protein